jgi:hypothetical protein
MFLLATVVCVGFAAWFRLPVGLALFGGASLLQFAVMAWFAATGDLRRAVTLFSVNTASRMESHGVPGKIRVSGAMRVALGDRFGFDGPYTVDVKGKGPMEVWTLVAPSD